MGRSEIRTSINRNLKHVFETYAQPDPWRWSDILSVRWTHGEPWEVESRMRIEPANSFGVIVDQVVTHFEPYRRVGFISHFGGVTMISHVVFSALGDEVTEVRSNLEFVGSFSRVAGLALGPAIEYGARRFYEFLKQECERESPAQIPPGSSDAG
ncbi:MAG: hypothetical protein LAP86_16700 [Acidobacteriia bacterium]|nr:hypothetical protein [Terriglobia bacterium]